MFDTLLAAGTCQVWPRSDPTVYNDTQVTHLVAHAPVLSSMEPWGETVWYPHYANVSMRKNVCGSELLTIQHRGYVSARRTAGGALEEYSHSRDQTLDNLDQFSVLGSFNNESGASIHSLARGDSATHEIYLPAAFLVEPRGTTRLPPGVIVGAHRWKSANAACDVPAYQLTMSNNGDGTTELEIDLSPDGSPWLYASACSTSLCQPSGSGTFEVDFTLDPTYPFLDGQVIHFHNEWDSDNNRAGTPRTSSTPLTVNVQPEMNLRLAPVCSGSPGSSDRHPGATIRLLNTGGRTLDDVQAVVPVPRTTDGSGTGVDTTYAGHFAPAGVTVDCSSDGGSNWTTPCTSAATHVRFAAGSLLAYTSLEVEVHLDVPTGTAVGTPIFVTAGLDAAGLLPIEAQTVAPARVQLCPGRVDVNIWFDADADGVRDPGEAGLGHWPVTLRSTRNDEFPVALISQGTGSIALPGGTIGSPETYGWSATNPSMGEGVWSWTTHVAEYLDVVSDDTVLLNLPAICACDDGDACTTDTCDHLGQCSHEGGNTGPDPDETHCNGLDDDCDGLSDEGFVGELTTCGTGVCQSSGRERCVNGVVIDTCSENEPFVGGSSFETGFEGVRGSAFLGANQLSSGGVEGVFLTWSEDDGVEDTGHVYGTAPVFESYTTTQRHYGFSDPVPPLNRLLGGRIEGYFRTFAGEVRAHSGTAATARGRWFINARGADGVAMIWVSRDEHDWNPNDDPEWTLHGVDIVYENFALWTPFRTTGAIGTRTEFEDTVRNVTSAGVWFTDAALTVGTHLHASWYNRANYALYAVGTAPVQLGWDRIRYISAETSDAVCDGIDDDCDGDVDEDFPSETTSCGVGACAATGQWVCDQGVATNTCVQGTPVTESCNDADDDCDGLIDEDLTEVVPCGEGACAVGTGTRTCVNGVEQDTCDPAWSAIPDTQCGANSVVAYAIVYDSRGVPGGTVRCNLSGLGEATCDEAPGAPGVLRVYDELWCPGAAP